MSNSIRSTALRFFTLSTLAASFAACSVPSEAGDEAIDSASAAACVSVDPARSLFVTDPEVMAQFPFQDVMNQIVARASVGAQTSLQLYKQWWDTQNDAAHAQTQGPHCDDQKTLGQPSVNGFPIQCPRQEGTLAATNPFVGTGPDTYLPIGVVNRFDLAPSDGSHCGEYRVVYGKRSGLTNPLDRNLIIFEARLPNPHPEQGLDGCTDVASFWGDLTNDNNASSRATKLRSFYFTGLPGFAPVIDPAHFFGSENGSGQIRTNQFMSGRPYLGGPPLAQQWQLREFRLTRPCAAGVCRLVVRESSVKNNPFGGLFALSGNSTQAFRDDFLQNQLPLLITNDINAISLSTPLSFNAGQSSEQDASNDYGAQLAQNPAFAAQIEARLDQLGRPDLSADNAADRATTQSCAGCHQLSPGTNLGGGVVWPASNVFTQIDENRTLSPALTTTFLPHRKQVLEAFLCGG